MIYTFCHIRLENLSASVEKLQIAISQMNQEKPQYASIEEAQSGVLLGAWIGERSVQGGSQTWRNTTFKRINFHGLGRR